MSQRQPMSPIKLPPWAEVRKPIKLAAREGLAERSAPN